MLREWLKNAAIRIRVDVAETHGECLLRAALAQLQQLREAINRPERRTVAALSGFSDVVRRIGMNPDHHCNGGVLCRPDRRTV
jgi:hypothetical protein